MRFPRIELAHGRSYRWEIWDVLGATLATFLLLVFMTIASVIVFDISKWMLRKPAPPPKVITVHDSAMSGAQNAYIEQCEKAGNGNSYGVPDVHGSTWMCTFPR